MNSRELEFAKGDDFYGGRAELTALFKPLRSEIEVERRMKMN
jgi:hypothetical protein